MQQPRSSPERYQACYTTCLSYNSSSSHHTSLNSGIHEHEQTTQQHHPVMPMYAPLQQYNNSFLNYNDPNKIPDPLQNDNPASFQARNIASSSFHHYVLQANESSQQPLPGQVYCPLSSSFVQPLSQDSSCGKLSRKMKMDRLNVNDNEVSIESSSKKKKGISQRQTMELLTSPMEQSKKEFVYDEKKEDLSTWFVNTWKCIEPVFGQRHTTKLLVIFDNQHNNNVLIKIVGIPRRPPERHYYGFFMSHFRVFVSLHRSKNMHGGSHSNLKTPQSFTSPNESVIWSHFVTNGFEWGRFEYSAESKRYLFSAVSTTFIPPSLPSSYGSKGTLLLNVDEQHLLRDGTFNGSTSEQVPLPAYAQDTANNQFQIKRPHIEDSPPPPPSIMPSSPKDDDSFVDLECLDLLDNADGSLPFFHLQEDIYAEASSCLYGEALCNHAVCRLGGSSRLNVQENSEEALSGEAKQGQSYLGEALLGQDRLLQDALGQDKSGLVWPSEALHGQDELRQDVLRQDEPGQDCPSAALEGQDELRRDSLGQDEPGQDCPSEAFQGRNGLGQDKSGLVWPSQALQGQDELRQDRPSEALQEQDELRQDRPSEALQEQDELLQDRPSEALPEQDELLQDRPSEALQEQGELLQDRPSEALQGGDGPVQVKPDEDGSDATLTDSSDEDEKMDFSYAYDSVHDFRTDHF